MSKWKETTLSEVIILIGGGTPKTTVAEYWDGSIPWLSVKDFNNKSKYVYSTEKSITELGLYNSSTKLLDIDDIIISARGTVGELAMIPYPMAFNQSCYGIRAMTEKIDCHYLYYLLTFKISDLKSKTHGSVFDTITRDTFDLIDVNLPPIAEQKRIAGILGSLDDKIELNNRINKNLEEQAQALFKRWFVDFEFPDENGNPYKSSGGEFIDSELGQIPKGWQVNKFTSIINVLGGGTPKTTEPTYWNGEIPFFTPKDVTNSCVALCTEKNITLIGLNKCNSRLYSKGTVFITARGTVGKVSIAGCDMAMNQSCYALIGKDVNTQSFVYHITLNTIDVLKNKASGAVFDAITTRDFESESIIIPSSNIISKFEESIISMYDAILNNNLQNKNLSDLRNTLLPKLMNNEITL